MKKNNTYLSFLCGLVILNIFTPKNILAQTDTTNKNVATRLAESLKVGFLLQSQATYIQDRPQVKPANADDVAWNTQLQLWRANILLTGKINDKTGFFAQTTILNPIGAIDNVGNKNTQGANFILLDAQLEHEISENAFLYGGMQLVNINRQGLQAPGTLLGLDFGWHQYPHLFASGGANTTASALQNNFGRDIGVNFRGYLWDKLEVRAGVFRGGAINGTRSNLRGALRLNYNIFEEEKSHYYTGQSMGEKKILAIGAGIDVQEDYMNIAGDVFLDLPLGLDDNALTWSASVMQMTGGNSLTKARSYTGLIPTQTIYFTEVGFLFKELNLQPYIKYEGVSHNIGDNQFIRSIDAQNLFTNGVLLPNATRDNFNTMMNTSRWGVGLNYYFEGNNHNLKLQYESVSYGQRNNAEYTTQQGGEFKLQWTYFMF